MSDKRTAKIISNKEDIDFILSLSEQDLLKTSTFMKLFGTIKGKARFNTYDIITIPPNSYGINNRKNKNAFNTTIGIYLFNKTFIENDLFDLIGYINKTINGDIINEIDTKMSYAVLEDEIDISVLKRFHMKNQKYMSYVSIITPSYTMKMFTIGPKVEAKKKELLKQYGDKIAQGDEKAADAMEKDLLKFAKEYMGDDPSMDMYNSGAKGKFGNHFKNLFLMKGVIKDPDPNKGYNIALSNYSEGISKEEYAVFANSLAAGPYSRSNKTQIGGYWEKLFLSAFQHVVLDKPGSDCDTNRTITVTLDNFNLTRFMYSYIVEGERLTELTSKNIDKYRGKTAKIRFTSLCESKTGICNKCAGNLFYRLGITNIGALTPQIASKLKLTAMKAFHDSTVKFVEMDVAKAFGIK